MPGKYIVANPGERLDGYPPNLSPDWMVMSCDLNSQVGTFTSAAAAAAHAEKLEAQWIAAHTPLNERGGIGSEYVIARPQEKLPGYPPNLTPHDCMVYRTRDHAIVGTFRFYEDACAWTQANPIPGAAEARAMAEARAAELAAELAQAAKLARIAAEERAAYEVSPRGQAEIIAAAMDKK